MGISKEFWENCNSGLFTIGYCDSCKLSHYYPQKFCPKCGSEQVKLRPHSGGGKVISFSHVMSSFYSDGHDFSIPYTVVMVELDEGVQVVSKMAKFSPEIKNGDHVFVGFEKRAEQKIPVFIEK